MLAPLTAGRHKGSMPAWFLRSTVHHLVVSRALRCAGGRLPSIFLWLFDLAAGWRNSQRQWEERQRRDRAENLPTVFYYSF